MKLAEIFEVVAPRDCMTFFLSSKVFSRSISYPQVSAANDRPPDTTDLCLFLEVAGIDFLQLSFLIVARSVSFFNEYKKEPTSRKKKVALLACSDA